MYCQNCGRFLSEGEICTCRQNPQPSQPSQPQQPPLYNAPYAPQRAPMNGLAVAGFVVSLVSLLLNFWGTVGLVGAVLSGVGLSQVGHMQQRGKGLAIAGLVIGIFSILWAILLMTGLIHISTYWYMR